MTGQYPIAVDAEEALRLIGEGVPVYDIRPAGERAQGCIEGAKPFDRDQLNPKDHFLLCCTSGLRSAAVIDELRQAGFSRATGIEGGFRLWQSKGFSSRYADGFDAVSADRYARHLALNGLGPEGQSKLRTSSTLLIGAGGLGSPAALYLTAAGVGRLGLVDDDRVERSNLQRQVMHSDDTVGELKVVSARQRLEALNPEVDIVTHAVRLNESNALELLTGWDLVVDGSDNQATRYAVNDACVTLGIPLVFGAATGFEGQVGVLHPAGDAGLNPCYRCLFPEPADGAKDCATGGVLGVVPGMIGLLQATEAIKVLAGIGEPLCRRLLLWDALGMTFRSLGIKARHDCPSCGQQLEKAEP